jgi:hypothetical protein
MSSSYDRFLSYTLFQMYSFNIDWIQETKNMLDFHDNADADSSTLRADTKVSGNKSCAYSPA